MIPTIIDQNVEDKNALLASMIRTFADIKGIEPTEVKAEDIQEVIDSRPDFYEGASVEKVFGILANI